MIMLLCFNVSVFLSFIDLYTFQTCLCSVHFVLLRNIEEDDKQFLSGLHDGKR